MYFCLESILYILYKEGILVVVFICLKSLAAFDQQCHLVVCKDWFHWLLCYS